MRSSRAFFTLTGLLLLVTPASAQVVAGKAEFGVRQLFGERESAKSLEYRSFGG